MRTATSKRLLLCVCSITVSVTIFAQVPFWSNNGNTVGTNDRLGSNNNMPLKLYTYGTQRASISSSGVFQVNNLSGTGTGFVSLDASGNLSRTSFNGDGTTFLGGDGTFHSLSSIGAWATNGTDVYNTNPGAVGIGTNYPSYGYILDVNGNIHVNGIVNALGVVIANKMQADTIKGTSAISVNNNLNFSGGSLNEIYTYTGNVRIQSRAGYNGNVALCAGTNGNVGVGMYSPQYKFDVNGDARLNGRTQVYRIVPLNGDTLIRFGDSTIYLNPYQNLLSANPYGSYKGIGVGFGVVHSYGFKSVCIGQKVGTDAAATNAVVIGTGASNGPIFNNTIANSLMVGFNSDKPTLFVSPANGAGTTGGVCIGDSYVPPGYKLAVNGNMIAEQVDVKLRGFWPDTVFASGYDLMPLGDLAAYVHKEHHLPGVPSAADVQQKGTYDLGQTEEILLQKMEELTLYITQLDARVEQLEKENNGK